MYNIFLRGRELILISSNVTATRVLSAVPERIFSRPFSEKSSELPFQNFDGLLQENENEFWKINIETVFYVPKSVK